MSTLTVHGIDFTLSSIEKAGRHFPVVAPIPQNTKEQVRAVIAFEARAAEGYASRAESLIEAARLALSVA